MDKREKNEVIRQIRELEYNSSSMNAVDAEKLMGNVIKQLLLEENFKLEIMNKFGDIGIDFRAVKEEKNMPYKTTIGIEYKHYSRGSMVSKHEVMRRINNEKINSLNRLIVLTNSKFTKESIEAAKRDTPIAIELMDIDGLKAWISGIEIESDINKLEIDGIIKVVSHKFALLVAEDPNNLNKIEWRELERMLAEVFEGIGFKVELTPSSKDGGKDIILTCNVLGQKKSYIVEVKHWRSGVKVGYSDIKDFLNVIVKEKRDSGLYLSTFGYCNNVCESLTEIEKKKIRLGDKEKIVSLCKTYTKMESGIWSSPYSLPDILFENYDY